MTTARFKLIDLQHRTDDRGNLTVAEVSKEVPFEPKRIYVLDQVPAGKERGNHGHKNLEQVIVVFNGSVTLTVDDGAICEHITLNSAKQALYIPKMSWRTLKHFTPGSVCMVIASDLSAASSTSAGRSPRGVSPR